MLFDIPPVAFGVACLVQKGLVRSVLRHPVPGEGRGAHSIAFVEWSYAQEFPHGKEVYPILDGMGSEGMAESVKRDACCC